MTPQQQAIKDMSGNVAMPLMQLMEVYDRKDYTGQFRKYRIKCRECFPSLYSHVQASPHLLTVKKHFRTLKN